MAGQCETQVNWWIYKIFSTSRAKQKVFAEKSWVKPKVKFIFHSLNTPINKAFTIETFEKWFKNSSLKFQYLKLWLLKDTKDYRWKLPRMVPLYFYCPFFFFFLSSLIISNKILTQVENTLEKITGTHQFCRILNNFLRYLRKKRWPQKKDFKKQNWSNILLLEYVQYHSFPCCNSVHMAIEFSGLRPKILICIT